MVAELVILHMQRLHSSSASPESGTWVGFAPKNNENIIVYVSLMIRAQSMTRVRAQSMTKSGLSVEPGQSLVFRDQSFFQAT